MARVSLESSGLTPSLPVPDVFLIVADFFGVAMYTTAQALVYVSLCPGHELSDTVYVSCLPSFNLCT